MQFWIVAEVSNVTHIVLGFFLQWISKIILFVQCDGYALDLANGPRLEGIALLNIPSIYGGTNLWGDNPSQKKRRKAQKAAKKDKDREFSTSSMSSAELSIAVQGL